MSRHGRAKQHGPEPPAGIYTKPPPPVHGNNTYNGRAAHHHYQQQSQQQQHHQQLLQEQFYGGVQPQHQQQQSSVVGARPASSSYHHHSLPRNAWSADRHAHAAGGSSSTSSNERTYTINRRAKHHRVYNSYRQPSRTLHKGVGGGATTDPDALSSVTTAGVRYGQQPPQQQLHHQSQHQLHHNRPQMVAAAAWPPESSAVHHQQPVAAAAGPSPPSAAVAHYPPPSLPPQNPPAAAAAAAVVPRQPAVATTGLPTAATRHHQHLHTATVPLLLSSGDVAVDACGGHCPRFENFCHFCLLVFYFSGITVGFLLIMAAVVTTRDSRFLYIGGLVLPVSAFLMAVQCRVRRDADRRKRHRQLNGRYHHRSNAAGAIPANSNNNGGGAGQPAGVAAAAAETIPMQNIVAVGAGDNTLRRQFQGSVYQYVGQRDESNYAGANSHHYETASDLQQIEGVPWWRREDGRQYHGRAPHL